MIDFLNNLLALSLEAAPWLVLGLIIGGLIKSAIPNSFLQKHLSGSGFLSIVKAAIFGAPLPLCSCGVIPAALGLRRAGASKPATVSFLVSTPETGIDSVTISYALLGPFMAVVRPIAAIVSAITAGLLVGRSEDDTPVTAEMSEAEKGCCSTKPKLAEVTSCCSTNDVAENSINQEQITCSDSETAQGKTNSCCESSSKETLKKPAGIIGTMWNDIVDSFEDLFRDVLFWLVIGLVFAALVKTFVPITFLAEWGSGLPAMLIMLVIGIPMYVCATASTPLAAGLLLAGVSPGVAMVFLMAGPATNISTLGIIGKELGRRSLIAYLTGVGVIALLTGFIVDYLVELWNIDVQTQIAHSQDMVPSVIAWVSLLILVAVVIKLKVGKLFAVKTVTFLRLLQTQWVIRINSIHKR